MKGAEERAEPETRFLAQHRIPGRRQIRFEGKTVTVDVNEGESPLGWLRRRKGPGGKPLLSLAQFAAGERLRRDFTLGQMMPRLTADLMCPVQDHSVMPHDQAAITDNALAARERVARALRVVGPTLSDILICVCCHLEGLEAAEKNFGWPRRAGKLVLQIALDRLAVHYGMKKEG